MHSLFRLGRSLASTAFLGLAAIAATPAWPASDRELMPVQEALAKDDLNEAHRLLEALLASQPDDAALNGMLGEIHWRRGELRDAREHFDKARTQNAGDARALAGLALVALAQDDLESAAPLAEGAIAGDKKLWLGNFAMGRVQLAQGNVEKAYEFFERGKDTKNRADGRDLFEEGMGLLALSERDVEGAETNLIRARALAPNTVEHVMSLAAMYESTGQWGQAANVLEDMAAKIGKSPQLSYRLGRAYENLRRWNDAVREYQSTLQADSTFAPALAALGHLYLLDTSKTAHAIALLSRAVAQRPTPATRLDLGIALTRDNRAAEALPHLEAAVAANPEPAARLSLARAYLRSDTPEKGIAIFRESPDLAAEAQAADLVQVAAACITAKDYTQARAYLDEAEAKEPALPDIAYRRGLIFLYEKNYAAAIEQFQKRLAADPQHPTTWINLGIAHQGNRDPKAAADAYRKATELAPGSLQAWTLYADALASAGANDQAQAAYGKALEVDPRSAAALRGRGYLLLLAKQYPQSIADLRLATQTDPKDAWGWVWLGQALLNSGNKAEAQAAFQKAIALDPTNESAKEGLDLLRGD